MVLKNYYKHFRVYHPSFDFDTCGTIFLLAACVE